MYIYIHSCLKHILSIKGTAKYPPPRPTYKYLPIYLSIYLSIYLFLSMNEEREAYIYRHS